MPRQFFVGGNFKMSVPLIGQEQLKIVGVKAD